MCSMAEMEDEEAQMERLLKLLTNYCTAEYVVHVYGKKEG